MLRTIAARFGLGLALLAVVARIAAGVIAPAVPFASIGFGAMCHAGDTPAPAPPLGECPICPFCTALAGPVLLPSSGVGLPEPKIVYDVAYLAPAVISSPAETQTRRPPSRGPPNLT